MTEEKQKIREEVIERGGDILRSDIFKKAMSEKHHTVNVGVHSIGVAQDSLIVANRLEKLGFHPDREVLVRAALLHDLGTIDRRERYGSSLVSMFRHPPESVRVSEELFSGLSSREKDCILHHMWPLLPVPPHTVEGFIIGFADKKSSFRETMRRKRQRD